MFFNGAISYSSPRGRISSSSKYVFVLNHEYTISGANIIDLTTLEERSKSSQHSVVLIGS